MKSTSGIHNVEQVIFVRQHPGFEEFSGFFDRKAVSVGLTSLGQFHNKRALNEFKQAIERVMRITHPNIASTLSIDVVEPLRLSIQWERCDGESLEALLEREGPLNAPEATTIAVGLAQALDAAHHLGVVHGGVGVQWVKITNAHEAIGVKLWGFGLAALPEFALGRSPTIAEDVLALSVVLHQMLTGSVPNGDQLGQLPPSSSHLAAFLSKGLGLDGSGGFASAAEFARSLSDLSRPAISEGTSALPPTAKVQGVLDPVSLGKWNLERLIGEGSMGHVYLARHKVLARQAAIKVLRSDRSVREALVERFIAEARSVSQINHPHIVEIFDFGEELGPEGTPDTFYFVMELLQGETLRQRMSRGALTVDRIVHIARQIAEALSAAHRLGVIHRDIKSDNIFLTTRHGDPEFVKVLDFGIAKLSSEAHGASRFSTVEGVILGTPVYMAPEQASGRPADCRTDVYAIGVLLYEMLTGKFPHEADDFAKLLAQILATPAPPLSATTPNGETIPMALADLTLRCLEKNPDDRPQSMDAFLEDLAAAAARFPIRATLRRAINLKGHRVWFAAGGLAIVAAVTTVAFLRLIDQPVNETQTPPQTPISHTPTDSPLRAPAPQQERGNTNIPSNSAVDPTSKLEIDAGAPTFVGPVVKAKPPRPVQITQQLLQSIVERDGQDVQDCVERHRGELPRAGGTIRLSWILEPSGEVSRVEVLNLAGQGTALRECLQRAVQEFRFPKNRGPARKMTIPFTYQSETSP